MSGPPEMEWAMNQHSEMPPVQQLPLAAVRIAIGWHFLYEAFTKLIDPGWTSAGYLESSSGPFAGIFRWLASDAALLRAVDQLNVYGLGLIGLALMLGFFSRAAALSGIVLLALYYFAHPPLFAVGFNGVSEGNYLIVNKNLVELLALTVVATFPATLFGLDALRSRLRRRAPRAKPAVSGGKLAPAYLGPIPRRQAIASLAGLPFVGGLVLSVLKKHGWTSFEAVQLRGRPNPRDTVVASATIKTFRFTSPGELKGELPKARIRDLELSRMVLGGNLIGGWAHARDLLYVDKLVRAYHHQEKIFQTFALAESCGVNAVLTNPILCPTIVNYWRRGGKIKFISDSGGRDLLEMIQKSVDHGAAACYIHGGVADRLVREGKFDLMAKGLDLIRANGLPAGIGGHKLQTIRASVEKGLQPDFWMKTLHRSNYWSAIPHEEHDNTWCENAEETAAFMRGLPEPWIAFKILAAGALDPKDAFRYAFQSGADFICVGMYDFQIVDDVNIALAALSPPVDRERPWRA
jgi:uncharacterized membrane protein YphA (DoxX/SURF4 family)